MSKKEMTPNGTKNTYCQKNYYEPTMMDDEKVHSSVRPKNV